jgi:hypothetical protein
MNLNQKLDEMEMRAGGIDDEKLLTLPFPLFDPCNYYGIAGEVARLASADSEADPMAVYASFLAASAALLGGNAYLSIGDSRHCARVFVALCGASSRARKGTSEKPVRRIIRKTEEVFSRRTNGPVDLLAIADGGLSSAEGLIYAVRDESEQADKKGMPLWDGVDDKRLLVVEEELANVFKIAQREGNTLSPLLRRAWDGGMLAPLTKTNRLKSTDPHINILGHVTQFELRRLLSTTDIYNGLANRFLWVSVRRTRKFAFPKPMDDSKVLQIAIKLSDAMKEARVERPVALSNEATEFWATAYHEISKDTSGVLGSITARAEAHVLRLGLLFCLLDGTGEIGAMHLMAAIEFVHFCNKSVDFIFSSQSDDDEEGDAQRLLVELRLRAMSQTDISRFFSGHKNRKQLGALLSELQSLNKIRPDKQPGTKRIVWQLVN